MADQRVYARTFLQTLTLVAGLLCLEKGIVCARNSISTTRSSTTDVPILDSQVHAYERNHPGRPWFGTLYGPPEVTGDQMVAAMDAVGVDGAILASPSACIATTGRCTQCLCGSPQPV